MKKILLISLFSFAFNSCDTVIDNNPVNEIKSGIELISMYAEEEDLINLFNNRFTNVAASVKLNYKGKNYTGEIEGSGAGSRYFPKFSFLVNLSNGRAEDLPVFSLSAQVYDKVLMKSVIATYLYRSIGFPVFFSQPVFLTVNNENYGLYSMIERINQEFFAKRNIPVSELYQVQFDARFTFNRNNNVKRHFDKELPDNDNFENLEEFINAIDTTSSSNIFNGLGKYLDIENYLKYHAITSVRHDPDAFTNNFYLYKETPASPFKVLPWDFDKTFDEIGIVGYSGDNEIIRKLFQNDSCKTLYNNYMNEILNNIFTEENLFPVIDSLYNEINSYYKYDPYLQVNNFDEEVNKIKEFITKRRNELLNQIN